MGRIDALGYIDLHLLAFALGFEWQGSFVVLHHDDALHLCLIAFCREFGATHDAGRLGGVEVGILEESRLEDVAKQTLGTLADALQHCLFAHLLCHHLEGFEHGLLVVVAAKLIHASHQGLAVTFGHAEAFHTIGLAAVNAGMGDISSHTPVGAHHAIVACHLAQLSSDDVGIEVVGHHLVALSITDGVVGHDGSRLSGVLEVEGTYDERTFQQFVVAVWIDGILSTSVVGITSCLARTTARPVLRHGVDALQSPGSIETRLALGSLEPVAIGLGHVSHQTEILAVGAAESEPAGLGGTVDLWRKGGGEA